MGLCWGDFCLEFLKSFLYELTLLAVLNMQQLRLSHFWLFKGTERAEEQRMDFHYLAHKADFNPAFADQEADKYISSLNLKRTITSKCKTCKGNQSQLSGTGFLLIRPLFLYVAD